MKRDSVGYAGAVAVRRFLVKGAIPGARVLAAVLSAALGIAVVWAVHQFPLREGPPSEGGWSLASYFLAGLLGATAHRQWLSRIANIRTASGELALGSDGLAWKTSAGETFVPWRDVREVKVTWTEAIIARRGDAPLRLRTGGGNEIAQAVGEARAAHAARAPAEIPLGLEQSPSALVARSPTRADYRAGAEVDPGALVRVAEDPLAPPLSRLGAVLRLPEGASAERARVRVAIDETLDPSMRAVLEAGLQGGVSEAQIRALASAGGEG